MLLHSESSLNDFPWGKQTELENPLSAKKNNSLRQPAELATEVVYEMRMDSMIIKYSEGFKQGPLS